MITKEEQLQVTTSSGYIAAEAAYRTAASHQSVLWMRDRWSHGGTRNSNLSLTHCTGRKTEFTSICNQGLAVNCTQGRIRRSLSQSHSCELSDMKPSLDVSWWYTLYIIQGHPVRFSMLRWIWYTKTCWSFINCNLQCTGRGHLSGRIVETNPSAHKTSTWLNLYSMLNSTSSTGNQYDINLGL